MNGRFEWVECPVEAPADRSCVLGAFTGQWNTAEGGRYEVVLPMFYYDAFRDAASNTEYRDCYVDADNVVRKANSDIGNGEMKYWCYLPDYPSF